MWWMNEQKYQRIVRLIEDDVRLYVAQELALYHAEHSDDYKDSIIANLALFDMRNLETERGYNQMVNLLSPHNEQSVLQRMMQLHHTLSIKYGPYLPIVKKRSLNAFMEIYHTDPVIIRTLSREHVVFWMIPLLRDAVFGILTNIE